jgi:hypothetical protein
MKPYPWRNAYTLLDAVCAIIWHWHRWRTLRAQAQARTGTWAAVEAQLQPTTTLKGRRAGVTWTVTSA